MAAAKKKKKLDPIKERERRAKLAALGGCLLLAAIGAYEVPKTMKMMKHSAPPPPRSSASSASSATGAGSSLPNVSTGGAATSASSSGLANTDVLPAAAAGQLVSFTVFQTKNPFTPQIPANAAPPQASTNPATTTPTTTSPTTTTPATTTTTAGGAGQGSVVPPAPSGSTTTTAAEPTLAISVNKVVSHVGHAGTFPTGAPVFRLVSWTKDTAQVGIVGGSYATGGATLTLHVGQPLTLENQTDGKRYRLELLSTP